MKRRLLAALILAAALSGGLLAAGPASAATTAVMHSAPVPARLVALRWAHTQAGTRYCFGGPGGYGCPMNTYDCSGMVMAAYAHAGILLPHNTVAMLDSGHLHWEPRWAAHWGDIVMWGGSQPFHEELFNGYNGLLTFGAHNPRELNGYAWQGGWWFENENFYWVSR